MFEKNAQKAVRGFETEGEVKSKGRRTAIKTMWVTPTIMAITLPAHAQTSDTLPTNTTLAPTTPAPTTTPVPVVPDLAPTINVTPSSVTGPSTPITLEITLSEVAGGASDGGDIEIRVLKHASLSFLSYANTGLTFTLDSGHPAFYIFTANGQTLSANADATITISANYVPPIATTGSHNLTATIPSTGEGGETNFANNSNSMSFSWDNI